LQRCAKPAVDGARRTYYRSGVGKLMHLKRWSRPEMANALRDLARCNANGSEDHIDAMHRAMRHAMNTPDRGLTLAPKGVWDCDPNFEFEIEGFSDASHKPCLDSGVSVSGHSTFLQGAPISEKSNLQKCTTLSVTEAELVSATQCAQDMVFAMRVLESMGLKVKKPMILHVDNKGAKDFANNWSAGGRLRHVHVREFYLRELKEKGVIRVVWVSTDNMPSDLFTKNLPGAAFDKHTAAFCGHDNCM